MAGLHVVFADDDGDDRFLIEQALNSLGISISLSNAYKGVAAINFLSNQSVVPDIIILDINVRIIDRLNPLERVRSIEIYLNIPSVTFSIIGDMKRVSEEYRAVSTIYLCKADNYDDYLLIMRDCKNNQQSFDRIR